MKVHGGPNLARGPEFDTHGVVGVAPPTFGDLIGKFRLNDFRQ